MSQLGNRRVVWSASAPCTTRSSARPLIPSAVSPSKSFSPPGVAGPVGRRRPCRQRRRRCRRWRPSLPIPSTSPGGCTSVSPNGRRRWAHAHGLLRQRRNPGRGTAHTTSGRSRRLHPRGGCRSADRVGYRSAHWCRHRGRLASWDAKRASNTRYSCYQLRTIQTTVRLSRPITNDTGRENRDGRGRGRSDSATWQLGANSRAPESPSRAIWTLDETAEASSGWRSSTVVAAGRQQRDR